MVSTGHHRRREGASTRRGQGRSAVRGRWRKCRLLSGCGRWVRKDLQQVDEDERLGQPRLLRLLRLLRAATWLRVAIIARAAPLRLEVLLISLLRHLLALRQRHDRRRHVRQPRLERVHFALGLLPRGREVERCSEAIRSNRK